MHDQLNDNYWLSVTTDRDCDRAINKYAVCSYISSLTVTTCKAKRESVGTVHFKADKVRSDVCVWLPFNDHNPLVNTFRPTFCISFAPPKLMSFQTFPLHLFSLSLQTDDLSQLPEAGLTKTLCLSFYTTVFVVSNNKQTVIFSLEWSEEQPGYNN